MVDLLRQAGLPQLADEAARDLPDLIDAGRLEEWEVEHGISRDDLISRFGGSP